MTRIHENKEYKDFEKPSGIVSAEVCKKSGKLPIENVCSNDPRGSMVYSEYFESGTISDATCDHHTTMTICSESGMPVSEYCPESLRVTRVCMIGGDPSTQDGEYMVDAASVVQTADDEENGEAGDGTDGENTVQQINAGATCNIHTMPVAEEPEEEMEDDSDVVDTVEDIALPDAELEEMEDFE